MPVDGPRKSGYRVDKGGLAGAVRTDQAVDLARVNLQMTRPQRLDPTERYGDVIHFQHALWDFGDGAASGRVVGSRLRAASASVIASAAESQSASGRLSVF